MPPTQEPFVEYMAGHGSPSEAPDDHFVSSDKPRVATRTDDLLINQLGTESIPDEEFMELIASSAAAYELSTMLDNLTPPTNDGTPSPQFTFAGEPSWGISDDEFAQLSSSSVTGFDYTNLLMDVEVPNPNPPEFFTVPSPSATPSYLYHYPSSGGISTSFSPLSNFNSPASFMSASTPGSFMTARSAFNSPVYIDHAISAGGQRKLGTIPEAFPEGLSLYPPAPPGPLAKLSNDYHSHLRDKELMPPPDTEINWSGKGQHVEFSSTKEVPLQVLSHLGSSISATVDKVQCKRIILARKMMRCTRSWKAADALREVEHLHKLRHFHIVQLVGSYLQGRTFSILMYPAADCHMGTFLEDTADKIDTPQFVHQQLFLASSLSCLTSAVAFIHANTTKHMDIKPANVLVRQLKEQGGFSTLDGTVWRVYLADFGLSTSFAPEDHSQTDRPTARTAKYCAPEVYDYESHGRSADIFSLGCVFLEILSVVCGKSPNEFADFRTLDNQGDESFRRSLSRLPQWVDSELRTYRWYHGRYFMSVPGWSDMSELLDKTLQMIQHDPKTRPTAEHICDFFSFNPAVVYPFAPGPCCSSEPEPYVAA